MTPHHKTTIRRATSCHHSFVLFSALLLLVLFLDQINQLMRGRWDVVDAGVIVRGRNQLKVIQLLLLRALFSQVVVGSVKIVPNRANDRLEFRLRTLQLLADDRLETVARQRIPNLAKEATDVPLHHLATLLAGTGHAGKGVPDAFWSRQDALQALAKHAANVPHHLQVRFVEPPCERLIERSPVVEPLPPNEDENRDAVDEQRQSHHGHCGVFVALAQLQAQRVEKRLH
mmetsp:Transcript_21095/g.56785  ORF Transcript_21095/g.56785 Transcript_21095/m.56785 type:complete len:230 (-) Transcript_21095:962-1651(-)